MYRWSLSNPSLNNKVAMGYLWNPLSHHLHIRNDLLDLFRYCILVVKGFTICSTWPGACAGNTGVKIYRSLPLWSLHSWERRQAMHMSTKKKMPKTVEVLGRKLTGWRDWRGWDDLTSAVRTTTLKWHLSGHLKKARGSAPVRGRRRALQAEDTEAGISKAFKNFYYPLLQN